MAKFLTGNALNYELEKLFANAEKQIILISPYIKLHERYASILKLKKSNPEIAIKIVFGKNEQDYSKSMKQEDFDFFKDFPNIEIFYERRLHAKYYANENYAILSSMNLYNYSQDNNIEAGIITKTSLLSSVANNLLNNVTGDENIDTTAWNYFAIVLKQADILYRKLPEFEKINFGLTNKYIKSKLLVDDLTEFFESKAKNEIIPSKQNQIKKQVSTLPLTDNILNSNPDNTLKYEPIKYISTTALSKELGIESKDLFAKFESLKWIERGETDWILTNTGKSLGAQIKSGQHREYIAWPYAIKSLIN